MGAQEKNLQSKKCEVLRNRGEKIDHCNKICIVRGRTSQLIVYGLYSEWRKCGNQWTQYPQELPIQQGDIKDGTTTRAFRIVTEDMMGKNQTQIHPLERPRQIDMIASPQEPKKKTYFTIHVVELVSIRSQPPNTDQNWAKPTEICTIDSAKHVTH